MNVAPEKQRKKEKERKKKELINRLLNKYLFIGIIPVYTNDLKQFIFFEVTTEVESLFQRSATLLTICSSIY